MTCNVYAAANQLKSHIWSRLLKTVSLMSVPDVRQNGSSLTRIRLKSSGLAQRRTCENCLQTTEHQSGPERCQTSHYSPESWCSHQRRVIDVRPRLATGAYVLFSLTSSMLSASSCDCFVLSYCHAELSMGWVDPRVGLGWVGSGMGRKFVFLVGWVESWV